MKGKEKKYEKDNAIDSCRLKIANIDIERWKKAFARFGEER